MRLVIRDNTRAAWHIMRRNRGRSFLTMLGIIIGIASVITVVGIGQGIKEQVRKTINHMGSDVVTLRGSDTTAQSGPLSSLTSRQVSNSLSAKDVTTIGQVARGSTVVPQSLVSGTVHSDRGNYGGGPVIATTQDLPGILNQGMAYGQFFTSDDDTSNVAVIGQAAALKLFGAAVPLGESFTIRGQTFTVQGVFNAFPDLPLTDEVNYNTAIYIPNGAAKQLIGSSPSPFEIFVRPAQSSDVAGTADVIRSAIAKNHGGSQDFTLLTADDALTANSQTLDLLTQLTAGAAAISLLVGGIGIMNVTLVSVTERMHEIGIRKAIGATNRQILQEFLSEAIVLSLTGGFIGIVVAVVINLVLRILTSLQPVIDWPIVALTALVSIVIGIVFGTAPALKAARKDPITALRGE